MLLIRFRTHVIAYRNQNSSKRVYRDGTRAGAPAPRYADLVLRTGQDYIESLRDGREVWIDGEQVQDVPTHPAFAPVVNVRARIYDLAREDGTLLSELSSDIAAVPTTARVNGELLDHSVRRVEAFLHGQVDCLVGELA